MPVPAIPKIYHIVHVDRLPSIVADGYLWCDTTIAQRGAPGTTIGMNRIKKRRLNELILSGHHNLHVGDCVPFYFSPRSVMLFQLYKANDPDLTYRGGQEAIVHLEAELRQTVAWADSHSRRWAFTSSNAGTYFFDDYADLADLVRVDWKAVQARDWRGCKDGKQAEFLIEQLFPWQLVSRIVVRTWETRNRAQAALEDSTHRPRVEIIPRWYY